MTTSPFVCHPPRGADGVRCRSRRGRRRSRRTDRLRVEAWSDLVVLDIGMRILDGVQALEAMRRVEAFADLPVIIVSGTADRESALRLRGLKVMGAIVKPLTPATRRSASQDHQSASEGGPARTVGTSDPAGVGARFAVGPARRPSRRGDGLARSRCDVSPFASAAGRCARPSSRIHPTW